MDDRERYGRLVHDTRLAHDADQAAAEGRARFRLGSWEDRSDAQRELDMRIGETVAAAEFERIRRLAESSQAVGTGPDGRNRMFCYLMAEETDRDG